MRSQPIREPDAYFDYYCIIPHPKQLRVLLVQADDGWTLPHFVPQDHDFGNVAHINEAIQQMLGLQVATRRCVEVGYHEEKHYGIRVYILDNLDPHWECPNEHVKWAMISELNNLDLAMPALPDIVRQWLRWELNNSPLRVAWSQQGWYPEAAEWVYDLIDRLSMTPTAPIEQIRAWSRSCTLHAATNEGSLYFKAVPEFLSYEPIITRVLSQRHPDHIPYVLAVDGARSWMLMRGFSGTPLKHIRDIAVWEQALIDYAEIQIDFVSRTQNLIALGFPDRHVDQLTSQIERLVVDLPDSLTETEATKMRGIARDIRFMGYDLLDFNIPLTLVHGDLQSENVVLTDEGKTMFYDWSDSCVTHPFFDVPFLLESLADDLPDYPQAKEHLVDVYLQAWTTYEPIEKLRVAYQLAETLAIMHQALVYHRIILPNTEPDARWEINTALPHLLRKLLAVFPD